MPVMSLKSADFLERIKQAEQERNDKAAAQAQMGKAADSFIKSMELSGEDPYAKMGMIRGEYDNLHPLQRAGAVEGLMMAQKYATQTQQAKAAGEVGPAIGFAADAMSPKMTTENWQSYYDTTSQEQPNPVPTPGMTREQAISQVMQRYPNAAASPNFNDSWKALMDYSGRGSADSQPPEQTDVGGVPYVWKRGSREFQPRADYIPGVRQTNAVNLLHEKQVAAPTGEGPKISADGKFYLKGNEWVSIRSDPNAAMSAITEQIAAVRRGTNAPSAKGAAAPAADNSAETQSILKDFNDGKLSREAAKVKLQALGHD